MRHMHHNWGAERDVCRIEDRCLFYFLSRFLYLEVRVIVLFWHSTFFVVLDVNMVLLAELLFMIAEWLLLFL